MQAVLERTLDNATSELSVCYSVFNQAHASLPNTHIMLMKILQKNFTMRLVGHAHTGLGYNRYCFHSQLIDKTSNKI